MLRKPKLVKYRDLKKYVGKYRIVVKQGGKHPYLEDPTGNKYTLPFRNDNDDVERVYVDTLRRKFKLTPEDGVSDEDFYKKR